jgi:hypothetical protein
MLEPTFLSDLIDLQRYPLEDDSAFQPILDTCRDQLKHASFASLPGFLKAGVAARMTAEVLQAVPRAYRRERSFSAYDEASLDRYPPDHVRQVKHLSRQYVVATDVLGKHGLLRTLYANRTLARRIAQMLGTVTLYPLADPVMGCTATVMYDGDTHGWHFDLNDFVVSILLQAPAAGGTFDFAPNIRDEGAENYPAVESVLQGRSQALRSVKVDAGTLLLFCGRRALHRVPPIVGDIPRVIALLSYDRRPDVVYGAREYQRVVGRTTVFES